MELSQEDLECLERLLQEVPPCDDPNTVEMLIAWRVATLAHEGPQ